MYHTHITQFFEPTVEAYPERVAVYDGDISITFAELYSRVLWYAKIISDRLGGSKNKIIAVYLPKSIDSIIADLAILYSGNTFMNLDVKTPEQRIENILDQTVPALIISSENHGKLRKDLEQKIFIFDVSDYSELNAIDKNNVLKLRDGLLNTDLMCIINTSGSTGTPKAVSLSHRSFIDFVETTIETGLVGDEEVMACLNPIFFDLFCGELTMLMAKGSTLVLIPETFGSFPIRMLELMAEKKATFLLWVPTIMVNIANMDLLSNIDLPTLKMVWWCGEVFPTAKFNYWRQHLPQTTFVNFYGPAETTVACTYHVVTREISDDQPIPIGHPFRNTDALVLDDENKLAKEGELCIRGACLALGYYNNPEKTNLAFIQNPFNSSYEERIYRTGDIVRYNEYGELVFVGRKDTLVKHKGYRIELTEIEHIVVDVLKIAPNCCVVYDYDKKEIVLCYESAVPLPEKELRKAIAVELPRYMVPSVYHNLTEMPRNRNGKIDRKSVRNNLFLGVAQ